MRQGLSNRQRRLSKKQASAPLVRLVKPVPVATEAEAQAPEMDAAWSRKAWFAVFTAYRAEFKAEQALNDLGYSVYCPRERREVRHAGKTTEREAPLLPRYIFVGLEKTAVGPQGRCHPFAAIKALDEVEGFLGAAGGPIQVPFGRVDPEYDRTDRQKTPRLTIADIWAAEAAGEYDTTAPKATPLEPGEAVRIKGGKFDGFAASVVEIKPKDRVAVLFHMFGRSSPMELKLDQIERA